MELTQDLIRRIELLERELHDLRLEVDRNDDWANGLFAVLAEALPPLLRANPEMTRQLGASWRKRADEYEALHSNPGQAEDFHDTAEKLEAAKMLYRMFDVLGLWPEPDPA
jgi:hypothetical protein